MKMTLFATAAVFALGLAACGGEAPAPAEPTPVAETTPEPTPEVTPAATVDANATPADIPAFMKTRHENYEDLGKNFKIIMDNNKLDAPDMATVDRDRTARRSIAVMRGLADGEAGV